MCGISGIFSKNAVADTIYDSLIHLQHRGQDAAGIATWDNNKIFIKKDLGLVSEIFKSEDLIKLSGNIGIGHVRYPTAGSDNVLNSQPFIISNPVIMALAHNGTLINSEQIKEKLLKSHFCQFNSNSDSEVLLNLISFELSKLKFEKLSKKYLLKALKKVYKKISGGFSVIMIIAGIGIVAFRDKNGIRPISIGKNEDGYMIASENSALNALGFNFLDDIKTGEVVIINENGQLFRKQLIENYHYNPCLFEYVYFSRPDSTLDSISVHKTRLRMGDYLGEKILKKYKNLKIDVVVPIPDTSRTSAMQVAYKIGAKYREGFMKNRYIGRTFIMSGQTVRKKSVSQKLNPIELEFKNKNVLLVDDSIVRGNTSKQIIEMVKKCGAKKVFFASASPPIRYQNVYGIDMPATAELIAHNRNEEEIKKYIRADELIYQDLIDLKKAAHLGNTKIKNFEDSVFSGNYCTGDITKEFLKKLEQKRVDSKRNSS